MTEKKTLTTLASFASPKVSVYGSGLVAVRGNFADPFFRILFVFLFACFNFPNLESWNGIRTSRVRIEGYNKINLYSDGFS